MELMLRVDDPAFAGEIRSRITEDIAVSERIDRARYRQMSNWWRKLKWTIAYFIVAILDFNVARRLNLRSEEHTSELQSLMRISYAVFCLKKKKNSNKINASNL